MKPNLKLTCLVALCASGLLAGGLSATAQDVPTPGAPQNAAPSTAPGAAPAAGDPPVTTVTVFGRLPKKPSETIRRLDRSSASGCAFGFTSGQDDVIDNYLDNFYGGRRDTANTNMGQTPLAGPGDRADGFSDSSPYGNAAGDVGTATLSDADVAAGRSDPCGQTDRNFAAGRNYIARKDKTMDQAFAAYDAGAYPKALEIFLQSYSKLGYDEAALMIGNMYLYGLGTPHNTKEAIAWYNKLADSRLVPAHYSNYDPKAPEQASQRVQAQLKLARIYMTGFDVPKDAKAARYWYKEADDLKHIPARYALARMYETGYGGEKDVNKAVKLYTDAAEYGYAAAQFALAKLYFDGDGVAQNMKAAFEWYQQAAFNPIPHAKKPHALYALAQMVELGQGTKADANKALALYKAAAIAGHPDAQNAFATYFYTGQIVEKNFVIARKLFAAAAAQGQNEAMVNLAAMFLSGEGGDKDVVKAYIWLTLAGKLGNPQAPAAALKLGARLTPEQKSQANAILKTNS